MSDKYCGLYVTFEKEIHEDYLEIVKQMILSIKGVATVKEKVSDLEHWMAQEQAKFELQKKLWDLLK